jgi:hypothetical protein
MTKFILTGLAALAFMAFSSPAYADGCYTCIGGGYVKYVGTDTQAKRKAAKACGCKIGGTVSRCEAANHKILCSVQNNTGEDVKLASDETAEFLELLLQS